MRVVWFAIAPACSAAGMFEISELFTLATRPGGGPRRECRYYLGLP